MTSDKLKHFLGRVRGDPFACINIERGKVKVRECSFEHEIEIGADCFFSYRISLAKFDTVHMSIEVLQGWEIDLLITNDYNFGKYARGNDFIYIVGGSILKVLKISNIFIPPEDGVYHIILDNTYFPEHGARPNWDINNGVVKVRFTAKTHVPLFKDSEYPVRLRV